MGTYDLLSPGSRPWDERRVAAIERRIEKIEDEDLGAEIRELRVEVREIRRRLDRTAVFAMSAGGLFVAVLGLLIKVVAG